MQKHQHQKKKKLRTASEVLSRLRWAEDEESMPCLDNTLIGYSDRLNGPMEKAAADFIPIDDGGHLPEHRIQYFRTKSLPLEQGIFWDRAGRVDRLFGSGIGKAPPSCETIMIANEAIVNMKRLAEEKANQRQRWDLDTTISRTLSRILRHDAQKLKLSISPDGYVPVQDILNNNFFQSRFTTHHTQQTHGAPVSLEDIERVVSQNEKQRFKLQLGKDGVLCIRANQGHTMKCVSTEDLLTPFSPSSQGVIIVHGTYLKAYDEFIKTQGLSKMKRNHIHFASYLPHHILHDVILPNSELHFQGLPQPKEPSPQKQTDDKTGKETETDKSESTTTNNNISGMRNNCNVFIFINYEKCVNSGQVDFWKSDNGVILSSGNNDGFLTPEYFLLVLYVQSSWDSERKSYKIGKYEILLDQRDHK